MPNMPLTWTSKPFSQKIINALILISILSLLILQVHNLITYPTSKGFDAPDHIEYIQRLKSEKRLFLAAEGWELYQPPLYYFLGALLPNIPSVKLIGLLSWLSLIILSYMFLKKTFNALHPAALSTIIIAGLPLTIYLTPAIGNEFFSTTIISTTFVYYLLKTRNGQIPKYIILGILLGLAILSKATAMVLIASITIDQLFTHQSLNTKIKHIIYFSIPSTIVGGWFYIRNLIIYQNPFVTSVDFPQYYINQAPGYRNLNFFITFKGFLDLDLYHSHWYSLLSGLYYSWFYDAHNALVPIQEFSKAGILLVIFSVPIFILSIYGLLLAIKKFNQTTRCILIYTILLVLSFVAYNFKLPFYSTVKASFLSSLILPFGYFIAHAINHKSTKFLLIFTFYLTIYILLITEHFWIRPEWYAHLN